MEIKINKVQTKVETSLKKNYTKPTLIMYGKLQEFTAGGSGIVTEASAGNKSVNNKA